VELSPITPWFALTSRELTRACARLGLEAPSFSSPPSVPGADRTLRRVRGGGGVRVAVRLWGRSREAIRADMIEGVLAANAGGAALRKAGGAARVRTSLEEVVPVPEGSRAA
jgi:hypothetical protein